MNFRGFPPEALAFLAGLTHHNDRAWFEAHRAEYEAAVVAPALALIADLDPVVQAISPWYRGLTKRVGGSLMRIHRDVRFSRDKTPYKTNVGIQFRHQGGADVHGPGFYVHLALDETFVGAGSWHPAPEDLRALRQALVGQGGAYFEALATAATTGLKPVGDQAVRLPSGFTAEGALAAEVRRKDFLVSADLDPALFSGPDLVGALEAHFRAARPYMAWLCRGLNAPF